MEIGTRICYWIVLPRELFILKGFCSKYVNDTNCIFYSIYKRCLRQYLLFVIKIIVVRSKVLNETNNSIKHVIQQYIQTLKRCKQF